MILYHVGDNTWPGSKNPSEDNQFDVTDLETKKCLNDVNLVKQENLKHVKGNNTKIEKIQ